MFTFGYWIEVNILKDVGIYFMVSMYLFGSIHIFEKLTLWLLKEK